MNDQGEQNNVPLLPVSGDLAVFLIFSKLPPFSAEKPELWFAQLESQFILAGVTLDSIKFHYVVANLDITHASEVEDIISSPPDTDKYEHLKRELIRKLSLTKEDRLRKLLETEQLGDRKPSQFLRRLKSLADGCLELTEPLLRSLWLRRLPSKVQTFLHMFDYMSLDELAKRADLILESTALEIVTKPFSENKNRIERKLEDIERDVASLKMSLLTAGSRQATPEYSRQHPALEKTSSENAYKAQESDNQQVYTLVL